jgi:hypothetical protein
MSRGARKARPARRSAVAPAAAPAAARGLVFDDVVRIATSLPGVKLHIGARARALKARGKLLARVWNDDETLVVRVPIAVREYLRDTAPGTFFLADTYRDHPYVLVRLPNVAPDDLRGLLLEGLRLITENRPSRRRERPAE